MKKGFTTSGNVGKTGHENIVHFTDDAAPSITLLMVNKRAPRWMRHQMVTEQIPLEGRREYQEKKQEWDDAAPEREEREHAEAVTRKHAACSSMRRYLASV